MPITRSIIPKDESQKGHFKTLQNPMNFPQQDIINQFNNKKSIGKYQQKFQMKIPPRNSTNINFDKTITHSEIPHPVSPRSNCN